MRELYEHLERDYDGFNYYFMNRDVDDIYGKEFEYMISCSLDVC